MQIRTSTGSEVIHELSSDNGEIILGGNDGVIELDIPDTSLLDFDNAVYDLILISPDGKIKRLLEGSIVLSKAVTK